MRFAFTDDQLALRALARELFEKESPPSRLRELMDGAPLDRSVWRRMADVGLCGLTIEDGDDVALVGVLEEAGRVCLPEPLVETTAVAAPVLAAYGTSEQQQRWLAPIAAGEVWAALDNGPSADLLLHRVDGELHALPAGRRPDESTRLGPGAAAEAALRAAAATAAVLNGVSMRLLEMTLDHVKTRHQFGRPVGSFQAVKHKLATMHQVLDAARPAAWYAAYALAHETPDRQIAVHDAKVVACESAAYVNTEALQCHGGIGFTWEHDLHLWLKRGKALEAAHGTAAEHRARLAAHIFDGRILDA